TRPMRPSSHRRWSSPACTSTASAATAPARPSCTRTCCALPRCSSSTSRSAATDVTVFDSVGFALEDYSALRLLRDIARELGLGETIDLIPALADPKDLFGQLGALPARVTPLAA